MDNKWIKLGALLGIIASILIIVLGICITPDYVERNLSPDGILNPITIKRINIIRIGAVIIGILILIFSIAPNLLFNTLNWFQKHEILTLIIITLSALIIRFGIFIDYVEQAGDGPSRAINAYVWSESPSFITHGVWLPGYLYLSGIFSYVIHDPLISTRILNMILGSLTILFFYLLVRSIYDRFNALLSSLILTFFPFHIALSVTSLTEVSFSFGIITGTFFLILASENHDYKRSFYLLISLFMLCLSITTRYEAWILIPLFPCYYFWKTKRKFESAMILFILVIFPILWMVGNFYHSGNLLPGYELAIRGTEEGPKPESLARALLRLGFLARDYMFWILPIFLVSGFFLNLILAIKKRLNSKQLLYFFIVCFSGILIIKFTMERGQTLWNRYILFNMIIAIPFAAYLIRIFFHNSNRLLVIFVALFFVLSPVASQLIYHKSLYLRRSHPQYIIDLADWLKSNKYRNEYILSTKMEGFNATLIKLYFHENPEKLLIVSGWESDQALKNFIKKEPSLLVFCEGDEKHKLRIEKILKKKIMDQNLIKKIGKLHIYEIKRILD